MSVNNLFSGFARDDYQREYFDSFLKKIGFKYEVPSVHIAGTNGKGSTAKYLASIYQQSGLKVGLFTSPYLTNVNEMILIDGKEISDDSLTKIFEKYEKYFRKYKLSIFEIQTFIAFTYFQEEKCDLAVIECGMGGEIDATNIFTPLLSIITSVSLEHTMFLGTSLSEITRQKCGILREFTPLLIGKLPEESKTVIASICKNYQSPLYVVDDYHYDTLLKDGYSFMYGGYENLKVSSFAKFAIVDASIAIEATKILSHQFPVTYENILQGLYSVQMPCRYEVVSRHPLVLLDGAHNPEAIEELCNSLKNYTLSPIHSVIATFRDKNIEGILNELALISSVNLTTFPHIRARNKDDYFLYLDDYHFENDYIALIKRLMSEYPDDMILITGSLAFAALVREDFKNGNIQ